MDDRTMPAERFERARGHLRAVAYRMLGSAEEADDAVQEAWLRACRGDTGAVVNMTGWLTTIVGRVCLDMLRARRRRDLLDGTEPAPAPDPAEEAVLAESVGLALLVVLDRLGPAERVAFVLHDLFAVPFAEIAGIVDRSPSAAKKLASRARLKVRGGTPPSGGAGHEAVAAFLTASRTGDLDALLAVLAPGVVRRADRTAMGGQAPDETRGARDVAGKTLAGSGHARFAALALVDGAAGLVVAPRGRLLLALRFAVEDGRVTAIDLIGDPYALRGVRLAVL